MSMDADKIFSLIEDIKVEGYFNEYEAIGELAYRIEDKLKKYCKDAEVEYDFDLEETGDPSFAGTRLTLKCNNKTYTLIATIERVIRASVTSITENTAG
jgi:hypothetical protein